MLPDILYVAECGSNHLGKLEIALELIQAAHESGAGAVKFQLFEAEKLDSRTEVINRLKPYELRKEWIPTLSKRAREYGMEFIVTPFDIDCIQYLDGYVDRVKISAYDITYLNLIEKAAHLNVPVILSTAMASMQEVCNAVKTVLEDGGNQWIPTLLHGVAAYPAMASSYSLAKVVQLLGMSNGCITGIVNVGLSDHTLDIEFLYAAVQLPITMAEKHFRLYTTPSDAPDYDVSMTPKKFYEYVEFGKSARNKVNRRLNTDVISCEMKLYITARRTNDKVLRG